MSAESVLAKPRRIKAGHRRRWQPMAGSRNYANNNPYKFVDPDGRNAVTFIGGAITESWNALNGRGFDGGMVMGALADGYNGEGDGFAAAAFQDATTLVPAGVAGVLAKGVRGTASVISRLGNEAAAMRVTSRGNINYTMKGSEKGWNAAKDRLGALSNVSVTNSKSGLGSIVRGVTKDGANVEIRSFSAGKDGGAMTVKIQETGSRIVRMYRWEKTK